MICADFASIEIEGIGVNTLKMMDSGKYPRITGESVRHTVYIRLARSVIDKCHPRNKAKRATCMSTAYITYTLCISKAGYYTYGRQRNDIRMMARS